MPESITKILFRKGNDVVRRTGGGTGIVLAEGEPGFCLDTGRLYVGDSETTGGKNIGIVNHEPFTGDLFDSASFGTYGYSATVYNTLTTNGVDTGDFLFSTTSSTLFRVVKTDPTSAVPSTSDLYRYPLLGQLSFANGLSGLKKEVGDHGPVIAHFELDTSVFTVDNPTLFTVKIPVEIAGTTTIGGDLVVNSNATLGNGGDTVTVKDNLVILGTASAVGGFYALGGGSGNNSADWFGAWSYVNTQSGSISDVSTAFRGLTPFAWSSPVSVGGSSYTQDTDGGVSTASKYGINIENTSVVGLTVKGTSTTATALSVIGAIEATGDITGYSTSDERLKTNIKPIENAISIIEQIEGVEFDWNCDHKSGPDVGVVAQQVEKVFPRVVIERSDGYKAVNYEKLTALLIQGIKELAKRINE